MLGYQDEYNRCRRKYLILKNGGDGMHITYNFDLSETLTITVTSNDDVKWILGEQWCMEDLNDKIIVKQDKNMIQYMISKELPKFMDDRLYCYPMVRRGYACFTGIIGLYLPELDDDYAGFRVTFKTNYPLFISGIGKIDKTKTVNSDVHHLKTQLFVFTKSYVDFETITLTFKPDAFFFVNKKDILIDLSRFIKRCYEFFGLKRDVKFLVNYNGWKVKGDSTGYGGNGNYAGFNFLVTEKEKTPELSKKIKIMLLHELFHHFNRSSDYQSNWFGEGFTEFFTRYLYYSIDKEEFIKECNRFIREYWINPYRSSSIEIMTRENFWRNRFIERLPYVKGFVYALYLLQKDRIDFIDRYKSIIGELYTNPKTKVNNESLRHSLNDPKFNDYIINGQLIELKTDYTINVRSIYLGFDMESAINDKVIKNIDEKSDAYKTGIMDGKIDSIDFNLSTGTMVIEQNKRKFTVDIFTGDYIMIPQISKI
jgi:hypothetical protein